LLSAAILYALHLRSERSEASKHAQRRCSPYKLAAARAA
jgi:hypothetical protein